MDSFQCGHVILYLNRLLISLRLDWVIEYAESQTFRISDKLIKKNYLILSLILSSRRFETNIQRDDFFFGYTTLNTIFIDLQCYYQKLNYFKLMICSRKIYCTQFAVGLFYLCVINFIESS